MPPPVNRFELHVNFPLRNGLNNFPNPYAYMRTRLYRFAFSRFALVYAKLIPAPGRKFIEFSLLVTSLFLFITLMYVHVVFVQRPSTCLDPYETQWDSGGILRIEVIRNKNENYTLENSYWKERTMRLQQYEGSPYLISLKRKEEEAEETADEGPEESEEVFEAQEEEESQNVTFYPDNDVLITKEKMELDERKTINVAEETVLNEIYEDAYIIEFSMEYGYLRLRHSKRKELNISVNLIVLDPDTEQCFGNFIDRFLLDKVLGYDNIILESVRDIAQRKEQKGFVRNIVMEMEYVFVQTHAIEKSYLIAGFIMLVFTLTISMLLRHSNHQIFIVIANILNVVFPRTLLQTGAPILTVILALVGMEAIMSEFFNDKTLANYVILIVWMADMYEAVCCHCVLSKRHWFRFFYLYHFLFYAYNYKFGGVYWPLSLSTSWLFTVHSMVWFFHHYELPRILQQYSALERNRENAAQPPAAGGDQELPPRAEEPESRSDESASASNSETPDSSDPQPSDPAASESSTASENTVEVNREAEYESSHRQYSSAAAAYCPNCADSVYNVVYKKTFVKYTETDNKMANSSKQLIYYSPKHEFICQFSFSSSHTCDLKEKNRKLGFFAQIKFYAYKIRDLYCKTDHIHRMLIKILTLICIISVQSKCFSVFEQKYDTDSGTSVYKRDQLLLPVNILV